ncbi:transmembrane protein 231 isoform X2 [Contarinia nasturtii]|nr:transmembrane protein 231 isoform X2 [Contarinia nasturtii]
MAEYRPSNIDDSNSYESTVTTCSSYAFLNELFQDFSECSMIKFWERDSDFDYRSDQMTLQLTFNPPKGYVLDNFNLYLEFDAKFNRQCHLQIPAAVILQQMQVPSNFRTGEIYMESHLKLIQRTGFHCPFFLRHLKSHFYHDIIPENSTIIRDYEMVNIRKKLKNNPAYMTVDQMPVIHWNRIPSNDVTLNIDVHIDEMSGRYRTSFWQQLGQIWIIYLSIFLVCAYLMEKLKNYIFSRQMIRAWEIIPWKKIY